LQKENSCAIIHAVDTTARADFKSALVLLDKNRRFLSAIRGQQLAASEITLMDYFQVAANGYSKGYKQITVK
jgi:hypothetical protein